MSSLPRGTAIEDSPMTKLQNAMNDPSIDSVTRAQYAAKVREINKAGVIPQDAFDLAAGIQSAKLGEGIYGIRRKNEELAKLLLEKPGSKQTLLSVNTPNQPGSVTQTNLLGS